MEGEIAQIKQTAEKEVAAVATLKAIEEAKIQFLGRKGVVTALMHRLKELPNEQKPVAGKLINELKEYISSLIEGKQLSLEKAEEEKQIAEEVLDVTLPGRRGRLGRKHPLTQLMDRILEIFVELGFSVQLGPDIESDYYNFEALNFAPDHPARDMHDTYYLSSDMLLRTHCTNLQVRVMETEKPPIRAVFPGKCYRNETVTARSHVFFHQVDGLYVDKGVSFADLISTLKLFLEKLFYKGIPSRIRASYFPFVEPGLEMDVKCILCNGEGCNVCKKTGWLEILGAGMVHPEVLKNGGIDPKEFSGFAWGMGLERLLMIKNGIKDIRTFTQNDLRFLRQFP